jgi:hypothetical protein
VSAFLPPKGESIVPEAAVSSLTAWANFYVIMGSSAGTLTGLMFVVITLIARARRLSSGEPFAAFGTPTIVHFGVALLVSAMLSAPWPALAPVALLLGLTGFAGVAYAVIVVRRARRQNSYRPVLEDWLWHALFPLVAYATLVVAAILLPGHPTPALFGVGAVTVLLLVIGIHNAWDNVTYIALEYLPTHNEGAE